MRLNTRRVARAGLVVAAVVGGLVAGGYVPRRSGGQTTRPSEVEAVVATLRGMEPVIDEMAGPLAEGQKAKLAAVVDRIEGELRADPAKARDREYMKGVDRRIMDVLTAGQKAKLEAGMNRRPAGGGE